MPALCQKRTCDTSFDHIVGERKQLGRKFETHLRGRVPVYDKFEFRRLQYRQVSDLLTLENPATIYASLAIAVGEVGGVAHKPTSQNKFPFEVNCRNSVSCNKCD